MGLCSNYSYQAPPCHSEPFGYAQGKLHKNLVPLLGVTLFLNETGDPKKGAIWVLLDEILRGVYPEHSRRVQNDNGELGPAFGYLYSRGP